jgi:hypothetical protein
MRFLVDVKDKTRKFPSSWGPAKCDPDFSAFRAEHSENILEELVFADLVRKLRAPLLNLKVRYRVENNPVQPFISCIY